MMASPKRKAERLKRRLAVKAYALDGEKTLTGTTRDISPEGMFIETSQPMPPGSRVRIEVILDKQTIQLEGIVAQANRSAHQLQSMKVSGMGISGDFSALQKFEVVGERREAPRFNLNAEVEIYFGSERRGVVLQDISISGMALLSSADLPSIAFARVNLKLTPDSLPITLDGVPARIEKKDDVTVLALRLLDPPDIFVGQIEDLSQNREQLQADPGT
jgi:hypothetical protein